MVTSKFPSTTIQSYRVINLSRVEEPSNPPARLLSDAFRYPGISKKEGEHPRSLLHTSDMQIETTQAFTQLIKYLPVLQMSNFANLLFL